MIFLSFLISIIILSIIISIITFIHELGHLIIAKKNNLKVLEFSIGFGPKIFSFKKDETTYLLKFLPFGGYVSVLTEQAIKNVESIKRELNNQNRNYNEDHKLKKQIIEIEKLISKNYNTLENLSNSKKFVFASFGLFFNFLTIYFLLIFSYLFVGMPTQNKNDFNIYLPIFNSSEKKRYEFIIQSAKFVNLESNEEEEKHGYKNMIDLFKNPQENIKSSQYTKDLKDPSNWIKSSLGKNLYISPFIIKDSIKSEKDYFYDNNKNLNSLNINILESNLNLKSNTSGMKYETIYYQDENEQKFDIGFDLLEIKDDEDFSTQIKNKENIYKNYFFWSIEDNYLFDFSKEDIDNYFFISKESYRTNFLFALIYATKDTFIKVFESIKFFLNIITLNLIEQLQYDFKHIENDNAFTNYLNTFINLIIILSGLNIIFNILPIPPLDGWKMFEYSYEGISKKKIQQKTIIKISKYAWFFIFTLLFLLIII